MSGPEGSECRGQEHRLVDRPQPSRQILQALRERLQVEVLRIVVAAARIGMRSLTNGARVHLSDAEPGSAGFLILVV